MYYCPGDLVMYYCPGDLISWSEHFPRSRERIGLVLEYSLINDYGRISCKILLEDGKIMNHLPVSGIIRKIGGKVL